MTPRLATRDDLPAISDLLVATWHDTYDAHYGSERVTDITSRWHSVDAISQFLDEPEGCFLVVEGEGRIAGTAFAKPEPDGSVHIFSLYIAPNSQRRGVGQMMLDTVTGKFPDACCQRLDVLPANEGAIRFYERNGFEIVGREEACCGPCDGIVHHVMERRLP